jgi:hypothetical protein
VVHFKRHGDSAMQHSFEPVGHLGMALKPWVGTTFIKGFDLIHRASTSVPPGVAPSPISKKNQAGSRRPVEG